MYAYYCINRPAAYGAVPKGYDPDLSTHHYPAVTETVNGQEIRHYGLLQYPQRLSFQDVWNYELRIADLEECALYTVWNDQRGDTLLMIQDYASQGLDWINEYLKGGSFDPMLKPMKVLLEAHPDTKELMKWAEKLL